jgi:peptidyl-prolyl cis-trans isomerase C
MKIQYGLPFAALLLLTACNKATTPADTAAAKPGDKPVATVNGEPISHDMFEFYVKNTVGKPSAELSADQRGQALDNLVRGEVIAQEALKEGLDKGSDAASELALSRLQILQQAGAMHYLDDKKPTEAEEKAEYDTQVAKLPKTEYKARHILVKTQEEAQKIIDQLKKGAKFEDLAKKYSTDSSKDQGGDLGFFSPQTMVPQFAAAVEGLKKGEYTQTPVQTQFGWHIIKLEDTREKAVPPFDQVKDRVAQILQQQRFREYEDSLVKQAKVEKYLDGSTGSSSGPIPVAPAPAATPAPAPAKPAQ